MTHQPLLHQPWRLVSCRYFIYSWGAQVVLSRQKFCAHRNAGQQPGLAVAVHPGLVNTQLARDWVTGADMWGAAMQPVLAPVMRALAPWLLVPPARAVDTLLFAATAPAHQVSMRVHPECTAACAPLPCRVPAHRALANKQACICSCGASDHPFVLCRHDVHRMCSRQQWARVGCLVGCEGGGSVHRIGAHSAAGQAGS